MQLEETRKVQMSNGAMTVNIPRYMAMLLDIEKGNEIKFYLEKGSDKIIITKEGNK